MSIPYQGHIPSKQFLLAIAVLHKDLIHVNARLSQFAIHVSIPPEVIAPDVEVGGFESQSAPAIIDPVRHDLYVQTRISKHAELVVYTVKIGGEGVGDEQAQIGSTILIKIGIAW